MTCVPREVSNCEEMDRAPCLDCSPCSLIQHVLLLLAIHTLLDITTQRYGLCVMTAYLASCESTVTDEAFKITFQCDNPSTHMRAPRDTHRHTHLVCYQINFGEHVHMWQLQLDHSCQSLERASNELGSLRHKLAVQAVDSTHTPALASHPVHKGTEDCGVGV